MAQSGKPPAKKKRSNSSSAMQPFKKPRISGFRAQQKAIGAATGSGPEWKNIDTTASITPGPSNGWSSMTCQNLIAQGAGLQQHVGRKIAIKKLIFRYQASTTATTNPGPHRIVIFYDNHNNGTSPAITDVFTNDATTAMMNLDNSDRFLVLADFYPFEEKGQSCEGGSGITNFSSGVKVLKFNPPLLTHFNNTTTATITAIQDGAIFLIISQAGTSASPAASLIHFTRIRYTDA